MAFVEVERQKKGRIGYPAAFTPAKDGTGRLRINAEALEYLKRKGNPWGLGDRVRIFHDPETGRLGLNRSEDRGFRLTVNIPGSETLRIASRDLGRAIGERRGYRIGEEEGYDLVLVPVE